MNKFLLNRFLLNIARVAGFCAGMALFCALALLVLPIGAYSPTAGAVYAFVLVVSFSVLITWG